MNRKLVLQHVALTLTFGSYVGYVLYDQFGQHNDTAIENAKRRGRLRGETKARKHEIEENSKGTS